MTYWSKYQTDSPANHQQPTSNQPASHHNKEIQEIQEEDQKLLRKPAKADLDDGSAKADTARVRAEKEANAMRTHSARSADEVRAIENVLKDFFVATSDGYIHKRCDIETEAFHAKSTSASESARRAKRERNEHETCTNDHLTTNHKPLTNNHKIKTLVISKLTTSTTDSLILRKYQAMTPRTPPTTHREGTRNALCGVFSEGKGQCSG